MIVSHTQRFIFFAVPKTATHSVREVLRPVLRDGDWEQQALTDASLSTITAIANLGHGHVNVRQIQPHIDPKAWQEYFKFAIVRNPFDRFVSTCAFLNRQNPDFKVDAMSWMKVAIQRPKFQQRVLVLPQTNQLIDEHGKLAMDYVGRFEQLQESVDQITDNLDLKKVELRVLNQTQHADYRQLYDHELREMVAEFYQQDLRYFDYSF